VVVGSSLGSGKKRTLASWAREQRRELKSDFFRLKGCASQPAGQVRRAASLGPKLVRVWALKARIGWSAGWLAG